MGAEHQHVVVAEQMTRRVEPGGDADRGEQHPARLRLAHPLGDAAAS